jgi:hypothetical protein
MRTKNSHVIRKTWPWPSHMPPNGLSNLTIVVVEERDDARKTSRQKGSAILGTSARFIFVRSPRTRTGRKDPKIVYATKVEVRKNLRGWPGSKS